MYTHFTWNGWLYKSRHMQWPPPSFYSLTKSFFRISDLLPCSGAAETPASNKSWIMSKCCATQSSFSKVLAFLNALFWNVSSLRQTCLPSCLPSKLLKDNHVSLQEPFQVKHVYIMWWSVYLHFFLLYALYPFPLCTKMLCTRVIKNEGVGIDW